MMKIDTLKNWLKKQGLTQIYISSFDKYLNEYVPLENNLRYQITGFSGSVGELLFKLEGKSQLFIDGRYTEQAYKEVNLNQFEIHTSPSGIAPFTEMLQFINKKERLAYIGERTPYGAYKILGEKFDLFSCLSAEVERVLQVLYAPILKPISWIPPELGGVETERKLQKINLLSSEAYLVTALDSIAWLVNGRGYHLPFQSSFLASMLVFSHECVVFIEEGMELKKEWEYQKSISWIRYKGGEDYQKKLKEQLEKYEVNILKFDPQFLNASDYHFLSSLKLEALKGENLLLTRYQALKEPEEIHIMKEDFLKASKSIYHTINWVKENWKNLTERDVYTKTSEFYKKEGGHTQSFNTIAGFAANGSIIHYGSPSDKLRLGPGEIFLLDSGAYFESGYATDKTRTFLLGDKPNRPLYKEIYTLVLKGLLQLQYHEFPEGTLGRELDEIARKPLQDKGYDYNHGTGHGVGINVHEGGVRIHLSSDLPMKKGQVVSIEPGIYLPEKAGVRLENIALVIKDEHSGRLKFQNLVFIGFDHDLIDESLLTDWEKEKLENYERECAEYGHSFKYNKN